MNQLSYFEIHATDPERAIGFYSHVFGWTITPLPGLPIPYWRIQTEAAEGGLLQRMGEAPPPRAPVNGFVCSMEVRSFDDTAREILGMGGVVALPKFAIPGLCWQGYFIDTEGNVFGIFQPDRDAR